MQKFQTTTEHDTLPPSNCPYPIIAGDLCVSMKGFVPHPCCIHPCIVVLVNRSSNNPGNCSTWWRRSNLHCRRRTNIWVSINI